MEALSYENRIQKRLQSLTISAKFLCAVTGFSTTVLSNAMTSSSRRLDNDEGMRLLSTLDRLGLIVNAFKPVPIALTKVNDVQRLLNLTDDDLAVIQAAITNIFGETT